MIKKLQHKIAFTIFLILSVLLTGILLFINISSYRSAVRNANRFMDQTPARDHASAPPLTSESDSLFRTHPAVIVCSTDGTVISQPEGGLEDCSQDTLRAYASQIMAEGSQEGQIQMLRYRVRTEPDGTQSLIFFDMSVWHEQLRQLLILSAFCLSAGYVIFALFSWLLARYLVRPVAQGFERQQQFISDAGHEFKTPLAVIRANADVLESEIGANKWLSCIQTEIGRTTELINSLLTLSKIDSGEENCLFARFDFSRAVISVLMPFESVAYEKEVLLDWNIPPSLSFYGDEMQIKQLTAILTDNAVKHAYPNTTVSVAVQSAKHRLSLTVSNRGDTISPQDQKRIFERFYRVDKVRSRSSGRYGLGLAIAKSIAAKHRGEIQVHSQDCQTSFTVIFPCEKKL